jgi:DNA polymerase
MAVWHFDAETYSEVDLKRVGSFYYARHPSTDVLCACWARGDEGTVAWTPGDRIQPAIGPDDTIVGYNIESFDAEIWEHVLVRKYGWAMPRREQFLDAMHLAAYANLPGALGEVAKALGTHEKDAIGARLMMRLCRPAHEIATNNNPLRLHTPQNLAALVNYCREDVEAERALMPHLPPELPGIERRVADATGRLNRRGIRVDLPLVHRLMDLAEFNTQNMREAMASATHGAITSETQLASITAYCRARGLAIPDGKGSMDAEAVDGYLARPDLEPSVRLVLTTRRQLGRSALAKLPRLLGATCDDGRVRGLLQYYGAHQTGRWAGRIVQPQNLPRGVLQGAAEYQSALDVVRFETASEAFQLLGLTYGDQQIPDILASLIRPCLIAEPGQHLHVGDYSAIEGRVLAWLAGEEHVLQAYRDGLRLYCVAAAGIYGKTYEEINTRRKFDPEYKAMDMVGKVVELSCGFQGAVGAFNAMGAGYGLYLLEEQVKGIVKAWRASRPRTVNLWYDTEREAIRAIRNPGTVATVAGGKVAFRSNGTHLMCRLPSGRCLWYRNVRIVQKTVPWSPQPKDAIAFMGETDQGRWGHADTYGGKLVENITQAVARDLLADAFVRLDDDDLPRAVCLVHDEIVAESVSDDPHILERHMSTLPRWADGLPMTSECVVSDFYRK